MINNWEQFESIRYSNRLLLRELPSLNKPILVAGCQRSGTTAVTRILRSAGSFGELTTTRDDELDAALILAGELTAPNAERLVLQTTYLNNHYREYFDHEAVQLVWILRNPCAVINSMLHNWSRSALRRLFRACGSLQLNDKQRARYASYGHWPFTRLEMACYSYLEKSRQALEIGKALGEDQVTFLDYDQLVADPETTIQGLCTFFRVTYSDSMAQSLSRGSQVRANNKLSEAQKRRISELCDPAWQNSLKLTSQYESQDDLAI